MLFKSFTFVTHYLRQSRAWDLVWYSAVEQTYECTKYIIAQTLHVDLSLEYTLSRA